MSYSIFLLLVGCVMGLCITHVYSRRIQSNYDYNQDLVDRRDSIHSTQECKDLVKGTYKSKWGNMVTIELGNNNQLEFEKKPMVLEIDITKSGCEGKSVYHGNVGYWKYDDCSLTLTGVSPNILRNKIGCVKKTERDYMNKWQIQSEHDYQQDLFNRENNRRDPSYDNKFGRTFSRVSKQECQTSVQGKYKLNVPYECQFLALIYVELDNGEIKIKWDLDGAESMTLIMTSNSNECKGTLVINNMPGFSKYVNGRTAFWEYDNTTKKLTYFVRDKKTDKLVSGFKETMIKAQYCSNV